MASELDRSVVRRRMEGWYTNPAPAPAPEGASDVGGAPKVDFSPVLAALQGKLATLTQENIGLRGRVDELEEAMGNMDDEYRRRMGAALESVSEEKRYSAGHIHPRLSLLSRRIALHRANSFKPTLCASLLPLCPTSMCLLLISFAVSPGSTSPPSTRSASPGPSEYHDTLALTQLSAGMRCGAQCRRYASRRGWSGPRTRALR